MLDRRYLLRLCQLKNENFIELEIEGETGLVVTLLNRRMRGVTTAPCLTLTTDNRQRTTVI